MPVELAGDSFVLVHVPEAKAIGGIDGSHAIIAPASTGVSLAAGAAKHCVFSLGEVTWRISDKTPGITNAWEHGWAGYGVANGRIAILIHSYAGHKAPETVVPVGPVLLLSRRGRKGASGHVELIPTNRCRPVGVIQDYGAIRP